MDMEVLRDAFVHPEHARTSLLAGFEHHVHPLPARGSSFFVHPSELCPVACEHCMFASTMAPKSLQSELSDMDIDPVVDFINDSRSAKLNISGGGEPFLRFSAIERLVEAVAVPRIEIVTAGYWAKSRRRAAQFMTLIDAARTRNPSHPDVLLRLSIDRYHLNAPRPVRMEHYANAVRAWDGLGLQMGLGLRSIQPDAGIVDRDLAGALGAKVEVVDDWNRTIVLGSSARIPITFNVFRESGAAMNLPPHERAHLRRTSMTMQDYYSPFETTQHRLSLATAVNDAIRGSYTPTDGLAVTLNSDLTFWIYTGTAPDRRQQLHGQSYAEAVAYFFADPITHLLVNDGIWALADLVSRLDPATHAQAVAKNDTASLVDDLLARPDARVAVTLIAIQRIHRAGLGTLDARNPLHPLLDAGNLTATCGRLLAEARS